MPEIVSVLTGLGISSLVTEALSAVAIEGAKVVAGQMTKAAFDQIVARFTGRQLPANDPLVLAVVKVQTDVLLGFIDECRLSLQGHDTTEARAEREWLADKKRELEVLRADAQRGALVLPGLPTDDLRLVLLDTGQLDRDFIDRAVGDFVSTESHDSSTCFISRVRNSLIERFSNAFRAEAASNDTLGRLVEQSLLGELVPILHVNQAQLAEAEASRHVLEDIRRLLDRRDATHPRDTVRINMLPPAPADFTDRSDELDAIRSNAEDSKSLVVGIRGMGGVGKSVFGLIIANELARAHERPALYVDMQASREAPLSVRDARIRMIGVLAPNTSIPDDDTVLQAVYRSLLGDAGGVLLIDDIKDAEHVRALRAPDGWMTIFTSRHRFDVDGIRRIDLDVFSPSDAQVLLQGIAPRSWTRRSC